VSSFPARHAVTHALNGAELLSGYVLPGERGLGYTLPTLKSCTDFHATTSGSAICPLRLN
jgi:hypothetical protein